MSGALFYYEAYSRWNRLRTRLQRLKNPRYLFGAIVGGLYLYWYVFSVWYRGRRPPVFTPESRALLEAGAAAVLMVVLFLMWVVPHERAALSFTEAEVAFLFPAPIQRRTLIHFKLIKSQTAILFSALFLALIGRWSGSNGLFRAVGYWGVLSLVNLHLLGSSFARTLLLDRGISNWRRRMIFFLLTAAALIGIAWWIKQDMPPPPNLMADENFITLRNYALKILQSGPLPWLLAPFHLAVAPLFATGLQEFAIGMSGVLALIALHYWWVIRSNVAFEEASVEASRKTAERVAAVRSGSWHTSAKPRKAKRAPFPLRPQGWPAAAIFWKNLISAGQFFTGRALFLVIWVAVVAGAGMRHFPGGGALGFLAAMLVAMSLLYGPQILRYDFRQDLRMADMLKLLPLAGWQMVLGEVLAPAAILAAVQWVLLIFLFLFCPPQIGHTPITPLFRGAIVLGAALVLPLVDFIALLLPNGAALIFPAWVHLGKDSPRGFETMGQQIILIFGQILVLTLTLVPAAIAGAAAGLAGWWLLGRVLAVGVLLGAMTAAIVLAAEATVGVRLLGHIFERFDWSEASPQ